MKSIILHQLDSRKVFILNILMEMCSRAHDWARIYIRHQFTEVQSSYAFEISSLKAQEEPHAVDPKDAFAESVWR